MERTASCLDESTVLQLLDGTLAVGARAAVEAHVAHCNTCADLTTWAALDLAGPSLGGSPERQRQRFIGQLPPGSQVGRYQILGGIGRGGMGEVYAAYHPDLDRRIALKVVRAAGGKDSERRARLLREARAIARLSHPNVVAVHDAGTIEGRVFIVMEYVDGQTVDEWLNAEPRSLERILDVFVAAGRGLAAAHAAGIVHRDFKPQNVMIGGDGSVRVMDFGLAWLGLEDGGAVADASGPGQGPTEPTEQPPPDALARVTETGTLLGTPAYMAPEQWRREAIDPRADQFSFCVALREALFGVRRRPAHLPSPDDGSVAAEPLEQRRSLRVPGWIRSVLDRGLESEREQRYPSMELLLQAIHRGRGRTRRRAWTLAIGAVVGLALFGTWRLSHPRRFDCSPPLDRMAQARSGGASPAGDDRSLRAALSASGRPDAEDIWRRLSSTLDDYLGRWGAMYRQTCEATHLTGEQAVETLDIRMRCLNENLDDVRALTTVLATADRRAVGEATSAVERLPPVDRCANVAQLRSAVQLPRDPQVLQAVLALQPQVKEAWALRELTRHRESYEVAIALRPRAEATGYKPLIAQVLEAAGVARFDLGDPALSEELLEQAMFIAEAGHDDVTAARVATHLIFVVGALQARYDEADRWSRWAAAILDRIGGSQARPRSWMILNQASVAEERGDYERSRVLTERAIELETAALGPEHPDVALSLGNLAGTLDRLGRSREALAACDRSMAIYAKIGARDFIGWATRGQILTSLGRYSEADEAYGRALRLMGEIEPASLLHAFVSFGLGRLRLKSGTPAAAISPLERALDVRQHRDPNGVSTADVEIVLAQAIWQVGGDRGRALRLAAAARDIFAARGLADRAREAQGWVDSVQHRRR